MLFQLFLVFVHRFRHVFEFLLQGLYFGVVVNCQGVFLLFRFRQLQFQVEDSPFHLLGRRLDHGGRMWSAAGADVVFVDFVLRRVLFLLNQFTDFVLQGFLVFLEDRDFVVEFLNFHLQFVDPADGIDKFDLFGVESGFEFFDVNFVFGDFVVSPLDFFFEEPNFFLHLFGMGFKGDDFVGHGIEFSDLEFDFGHFLVFGLNFLPQS